MWVTSLGLAGEAGIFTSLPFYPHVSGVPNGLLRLSPPQVHAAVHNSGDMNRNHFQLAMLAYNRNCWLLLFNREAQASVETLRAHHPGDGAAAFSVRGGQDLAARRQNGCQLQRSLSGKGPV